MRGPSLPRPRRSCSKRAFAAKITTASCPETGGPTAFMVPAELFGVSDSGRVALTVRGACVQVTGPYSARARSRHRSTLFIAGLALGRRGNEIATAGVDDVPAPDPRARP